jgi:hypothetical protein
MTPSDTQAADVAGRAAQWLRLAAAPTFALMALLAATSRGGAMGMLCSAGPLSPLTGMASMYLLMSAFHAGPWLELVFRGRRATPRLGCRSTP